LNCNRQATRPRSDAYFRGCAGRISTRLTIVLNGESLMNDATGLVAFKFALAAVIAGGFSQIVRENPHSDSHDVLAVSYTFADGLVWDHCGRHLNNLYPFECGALIHGTTGFAQVAYGGRVRLQGREAAYSGEVVNLYEAGAKRNIAAFYSCITEGRFENSTVPRAVDGALTTILSREATLRRLHLPGYVSTVRAGIGSIMPSYSSWNGVKCSASKFLLTDLLKKELRFDGFLISDYNAIDQITNDYLKCIEISINAGMDMVMVPERYREFFDGLKKLVAEGRVPLARIDDAATRILRVKFALGLMDPNRPTLADRRLSKFLK